MSIYFFSKINRQRNRLNIPQNYIVCVANESLSQVKHIFAGKTLHYAKKRSEEIIDKLAPKSEIILKSEFVNKGLKVYKYSKKVYILYFKNPVVPNEIKKNLSSLRSDFEIVSEIDIPKECTFSIFNYSKKNSYLTCIQIVHLLKILFANHLTIRIIKIHSKIAVLTDEDGIIINCKVNVHCDKLFKYLQKEINNALFYPTPIKFGIISREICKKTGIPIKDLYLSF